MLDTCLGSQIFQACVLHIWMSRLLSLRRVSLSCCWVERFNRVTSHSSCVCVWCLIVSKVSLDTKVQSYCSSHTQRKRLLNVLTSGVYLLVRLQSCRSPYSQRESLRCIMRMSDAHWWWTLANRYLDYWAWLARIQWPLIIRSLWWPMMTGSFSLSCQCLLHAQLPCSWLLGDPVWSITALTSQKDLGKPPNVDSSNSSMCCRKMMI